MILRKSGRRATGGILAGLLVVALIISGCGKQGTGPAPTLQPDPPAAGNAAGAGLGLSAGTAAVDDQPFLINTSPSGARVYVDGALLGETPVAYPHRDGKQHQLSFTLKGFGIQRDDQLFEGEGVTVDLIPASRATEQQRQVLADLSLLPAVRAVPNPAGNKTWEVHDLTTPLGSRDGKYLVGTITRSEGKALRTDLVAVDLRSGKTRQLLSRLFEEYPFQYAGPVILPQPIGWLGDDELVVVTQRVDPADPENPILTALKVNVATGRQEPLGDLGQSAEGIDGIQQAWLTADGQALFVQSNARIFGLDLSTGVRRPSFGLQVYWGFTVKHSPDGWSVAYGQPHPDGVLGAGSRNLKTGQAYELSEPGVVAQGFWWSVDGRHIVYGIGRRRADGSYPTLTQENTPALLLPDAIEVVDLATLARRQVSVPGKPSLVLSASNPERMVLMRADVAENQPATSFGWRLLPRGLTRLNALTGEATRETPLHLPDKAYVLSARTCGDDYFVVYQTGFAPELAYVQSNGALEPRAGEVVAGSETDDSGGVDGALLLLKSAAGLGFALEDRMLLGGDLGQHNYYSLNQWSPQGWMLLRREDNMSVFYVVSEPPSDI
ncbi:MAG: PEGA domain-containing protein [Symbiobacteriia bacterium]